MTENQLLDIFSYHRVRGDQGLRYADIREAALNFARVIIRSTPQSGDQDAAIRKVREAAMTANAAIALEKPEVTWIER
jgi:hypothetical protein